MAQRFLTLSEQMVDLTEIRLLTFSPYSTVHTSVYPCTQKSTPCGLIYGHTPIRMSCPSHILEKVFTLKYSHHTDVSLSQQLLPQQLQNPFMYGHQRLLLGRI